MEVAFAPHFSRQFKDLSARLQEEAHEKIELFKDTKNHRVLRVHKLKGQFVGCYSFSINYRHRRV